MIALLIIVAAWVATGLLALLIARLDIPASKAEQARREQRESERERDAAWLRMAGIEPPTFEGLRDEGVTR